jgi:hypothetical protein
VSGSRRLVLAVGVLLLLGPLAEAQAPTGLQALVEPLYRQLAMLKGIANPPPPPPIVVKSRDEARRFLESEIDRRYPPARLAAEQKSMVAWGLLPAGFDMRALYLDLMSEQMAAYYDPRGKVMVVGDWLGPAEQQVALLHELVHALQDAEVPLEPFLAEGRGVRSDELLARHALLEGEAVGLMLDVILRARGMDLAALADLNQFRSLMVASSAGQVFDSAPRFLRTLVLFPYMEGLQFVHDFRRRSPWSSMSSLYRDPPRSTAQILHPEQRLGRREDPIAVELPDLQPFVGSARHVLDDQLGEFGLGAVVSVHLGESAGRAVANGWRGDSYRLWESASGAFPLACLVVFRDETAAGAFARAHVGVMERRHPALASTAQSGAAGLVRWSDGGRRFAVEQRGTEVLILEAFDDLDGARDATWRSRPALAPRAN